MSNKANLRALREMAGLSQTDAAEIFNVHINSYKRWEHPNFSQVAPQFVYDKFKSILKSREQIVQFVLENEHYSIDSAQKITFTFYRNQEEFDKYGQDKGNFHLANANTLASAQALLKAGKSFNDIEFCFPQETDNLYTRAKKQH